MFKKLMSIALSTTIVTTSAFAMTEKEAQALLNDSQSSITQSIALKVASNSALLEEIKKVKSEISEIKKDITKNSRDGVRSFVISGAAVATIVGSGMLLYHTKLGTIIGGDRAGAAMFQSLVFVVGSVTAVGGVINSGINYTLVYIDSTRLAELEEVLAKLEVKIEKENAALK